MNIFSELKRRNVFKVGVTYAIVAWLLIQVIDTVLPRLGAPDWFVTALMVLLMLGFPVALVLAWAFEFTPDGIKKQQTADVAGQHSSGSKLNMVLIGALVLAVLFMAVDNYLLDAAAPAPLQAELATDAAADGAADAVTADATGPAPTTAAPLVSDIPEKSLAVLPFANLSNDPDQEYFADGLTEELLNKLAQVDDLQVTGRTSSFYYKGRNEDLRTIGAALGVAHLLEGSVRLSGNQIRITAQLVKADDGFHLWSQTFDRELTDIFSIQDEIASAITTALSITISAGEFSQPGMTSSIEAYNEFLQARDNYYAFTAVSVVEAIDHIERAVRLDPAFTEAWWLMRGLYADSRGILPPAASASFSARSAEALAKVRELDPMKPELRLVRAGELIAAQNLVEAESLLLEIMEESANSNADAARRYAGLLNNVGRVGDALRYSQQARRLDPLIPTIPFQLASLLLNLGRPEDAMAEINRGLALEGLEEILSGAKFQLALQAADPEAVVLALEAMPTQRPQQIQTARLWADGDIDGAMALVRENIRSENNSPVVQLVFGSLAVAMGYPEEFLDWARETNATILLAWSPLFSEVRKLPEFKEYVRERGYLDYWRATGNWPDQCRRVNDDFECF